MINLLPSEIKNHYKVNSKIFGITVIYLLILAGIGVGLAAIFSLNLIDKSTISERESKLSGLQSQTKQNDTLTTQAAFVESRVSSASQYLEKNQWDQVTNLIASSTPTNVQLTSMKIAIDATKQTTAVTIAGNSPDRRSVVLFKDKLSAQQGFSSPVIQSLSDSKDGNGIFTFGIQFVYKATTK